MNNQKILIDTNSLIALATYFTHFDKEGEIVKRIEQLFEEENILLLDAVKKEASTAANGIVMKRLTFIEHIKPKQNIINISNRLHNTIDNNWAIPENKKKMDSGAYEAIKLKEMEKADFQLIFYARILRDADNLEPIIVTEESRSRNDSKNFKKIPIICDEEQPDPIKCTNLSAMLETLGLEAKYSWRPSTNKTKQT